MAEEIEEDAVRAEADVVEEEGEAVERASGYRPTGLQSAAPNTKPRWP